MGTRKILVVYHRADYDGVFSGVIAKKYYESKGIHVDAFGWNYGDDPIDVKSKIGEYQGIILVDISVDPKRMKILYESGKLVWIDHHQTAITDSVNEGYDKAEGIRRIGTAACELTWEFFNPGKDTPMIVQIAGAYDVWNKERFDWEEIAVPLQYGLKNTYGLKFKEIESEWEDLCIDHEWLIDCGSVIYGWLKTMSEVWVRNCGIPVTVAGKYKGIAILTPITGSLVFNSVLDNYDLFIVAQIREGGTKYSISMYTEPSKNLDFSCGEYLKSLEPSAGGHACAAGGQFGRDIFEKLIFDHIM